MSNDDELNEVENIVSSKLNKASKKINKSKAKSKSAESIKDSEQIDNNIDNNLDSIQKNHVEIDSEAMLKNNAQLPKEEISSLIDYIDQSIENEKNRKQDDLSTIKHKKKASSKEKKESISDLDQSETSSSLDQSETSSSLAQSNSFSDLIKNSNQMLDFDNVTNDTYNTSSSKKSKAAENEKNDAKEGQVKNYENSKNYSDESEEFDVLTNKPKSNFDQNANYDKNDNLNSDNELNDFEQNAKAESLQDSENKAPDKDNEAPDKDIDQNDDSKIKNAYLTNDQELIDENKSSIVSNVSNIKAKVSQVVQAIKNILLSTTGKAISAILALITVYFTVFSSTNSTSIPENIPIIPNKIIKTTQSNTYNRAKSVPEAPRFINIKPKLDSKPIPVAAPIIYEPPPPTPKVEAPELPPLPVEIIKPKINSKPEPQLKYIIDPPKVVDTENDEDKLARMERKNTKMKSSIMMMQGEISSNEQPNNNDNNQAQTISVKKKGNPGYVLNKGKIIYAILETAINTDVGGEVKAIISQNVYSENAKNILIPRGSKIFGSYDTNISNDGSNRVNVAWKRIDLPSGQMLELQAISVDNLGLKGASGNLDMKYKEKIFNAVLTSAIKLATSYGLDKMNDWVDGASKSSNLDVSKGIRSTASSIFNDSSKDEIIRINEICAQCKNMITDKNSDSYRTLDQFCLNLLISTQGDKKTKLASLMAQINNTADGVIQSTKTSNLTTATKDTYDNLSKTVKDLFIGQNDKPNITIDQGKVLEIYVNEDYYFPQAIVQKVKFL